MNVDICTCSDLIAPRHVCRAGAIEVSADEILTDSEVSLDRSVLEMANYLPSKTTREFHATYPSWRAFKH